MIMKVIGKEFLKKENHAQMKSKQRETRSENLIEVIKLKIFYCHLVESVFPSH